MPISTVDGVAWASLSSFGGVSKANIASVNGVVAASPVASVEDTFDRADANPISNPASDGTSQWTSGQGRFNAIEIVSNNCRGTGTPSGGVINNVSFAARQRVSIVTATTFSGAGLLFRASTSNADAYLLYISGSGGCQFYRSRESGTALTAIGASITMSPVISAGDTISVEADGNSFQLYHNGNAKGTARSDGEASPYSTGSAGVYLANTTPAIASFSATDF